MAEYDHEMATTRKLLDRLPDDKLSWRPHEKSMSLGGLATHLGQIPHWAATILNEPSFELDGAALHIEAKTSRAEIVTAFDAVVRRARASTGATRSGDVVADAWPARCSRCPVSPRCEPFCAYAHVYRRGSGATGLHHERRSGARRSLLKRGLKSRGGLSNRATPPRGVPLRTADEHLGGVFLHDRPVWPTGDAGGALSQFVPRPSWSGGHAQTIYGWANPRYFPRLPAPAARYFDVDRDARVLAHCHWQPPGPGSTRRFWRCTA
jgi:hypothetical protein